MERDVLRREAMRPRTVAWLVVVLLGACGGAVDPASVDQTSHGATTDGATACTADCGRGRESVTKAACDDDCTTIVACGQTVYCGTCADPEPCGPDEFEVTFCKQGDPNGCRIIDACGVHRYCSNHCPNACEPDEQMLTTWADDCDVPRCRPVEACGRQVYCKEW